MSDETKKAETWAEFLDAVDAWWGFDSKAWRADRSPEAMRAIADAACEYTGKRVERHVAEAREACAQLVLDCGIVDDLELRRIADSIRARSAGDDFLSPGESAAYLTWLEHGTPDAVAAKEREAIAQMLEKSAGIADMAGGLAAPKQHRLREAAAAVRARGTTTVGAPPRVPTQAPTEAKASVSPFPCDNCTGKTSHLPWCYRVEVERLTAEVERMRGVVAAAHAKADVDVEEMATQRDEARADAASLRDAMRRAIRDFGGGDPWAQRDGLLAVLRRLGARGGLGYANHELIDEALAKWGDGK